MAQEYSRACLRVAVAQMCQHLGWNSIQTTPMELMTDVLERYLLQLGKVTHRYSEQFGRTYTRVEDVLMAFNHMGVELHELQDYINHVDALPFAKDIVSFPVPQENDLKFPNPDSKEVQQRKVFEYIPEYLPYMHPELNEEPEDTNQSARPASPERLQVEQPHPIEMSPTSGEKRPVPSPGEGSTPFKRQRLTTSQPLPEEASQSQYEMTGVVMTHSGILSPIREGKVPDSKPPPAGFKQIVIVRQKNSSKPPPQGSVVKLDIVKDATKGSKIVEVGDETGAPREFDRNDPDYKPKAKKKLKDLKRLEKLQGKPIKVKRGPGRPRSPARAAVVHNKGSVGFSRIQAMSNAGEGSTAAPENQDTPIDLTMKPTPPMPNISVVKIGDNNEEKESKLLDYRPKNTSLSKQQERDYDDIIDSVIGNKLGDGNFGARDMHRDPSTMGNKEKKSNKDEWRVSHISETYDGDDDHDDDDDDDDVRTKDNDKFQRPDVGGISYPYAKPPATIAPHLKFLYAPPTTTISPSRPRGRPRGSGSGFYKNAAQRSPMGGRRGRPPLHRGSPGRPPLSVGRPPLNRSPGRPPLNRSPGRPPLNRSPGRPSTGRSPGRPKGSGLSPRPRGRPRGSKSPRSRGASPRGGSPRAAIAHLTFGEEETNDSTDSKKTNIFKLENDDSEATLFEFPSKSSPRGEDKERKVKSPTPMAPSSPGPDERSPSIPSPAPTERAESSGSRDISPVMSPSSEHSLPMKKEPTPDIIHEEPSTIKTESALIEQSYLARELIKDMKPVDADRRDIDTASDKTLRESSERERSDKEASRERDRSDKEASRERDRSDKEASRERDRSDKEASRERDRSDKETSRERDRSDKETSRERDRDHREHKEHSRDRDRYKERDRDRDRDRERSKEHRKDKKKKKKKNKDRDKERERDKDRSDDKERKERHKERKEERRERERERDREKDKEKEKEKEVTKDIKKDIKREIKKEIREESPSIQPLQKLKIKFGGGSSSSPSSFSISTSERPASPKPDTSSPVPPPPPPPPAQQRLEIPKLKFKMLPPKPDGPSESDQSWVSSIKTEPGLFESSNTSSRHSSPASRTVSPSRKLDIDSDSDNASTDHDHDSKSSKPMDDEVTVSVVKGKIMVKKPAKRSKRKGSGKKGRPKGDGFRKESSGSLFREIPESPLAALKKEADKEASPISPPFSPQNVPSPITIPALKAAPPPPSPPAASKKISPPKPRSSFKDVKPESPLLKDITKSRPSPDPTPKPSKLIKSLKKSPKKSPKVSPTAKRKGNMSPTKVFPFMEFQSPKTPSPRRSSSPSPSARSSPMYSPPSSPERASPLSFQIPATPAFPTRSPPPSPLSRQLSTDEDDTDLTPTSVDRPPMPPPSLPPMPPTSAQRRAQRTVITETVGSFVNESGEKIWICPACTMPDDGSPMIGCDICDDWYHWVCVGIKVEPSEDEQWYCQKCKPNGSKAKGSKRGRKKRRS
ncbi:transcription initiation factor TFIID subunit 3 [Mactra antiquata]